MIDTTRNANLHLTSRCQDPDTPFCASTEPEVTLDPPNLGHLVPDQNVCTESQGAGRRASVWWHFSAKETQAAAAVRTPRGISRTFILHTYLLLRKANEGLFLISNLLICSLQKT